MTSISYDARSAALTALYMRESQLVKSIETCGAAAAAAPMVTYWKTELKIARDAIKELVRA
jgi:hypothetical protein